MPFIKTHVIGRPCLAPMVRASTLPLRLTALDSGASAVWSEEIIAFKLAKCTRIVHAEPSEGGATIASYVLPERTKDGALISALQVKAGEPLVLQLGSPSAEAAAAALRVALADVRAVELNMGCPKKFSTHGGMGSALLREPAKACEIIRALRETAPPEMPVFAKIRCLDTPLETVELCRQLVGAGASLITLHLRRVAHRDYVPALGALEQLAPVADAMRPLGVPVLANGDIYSLEDALRAANAGAAGFMVARPALWNYSVMAQHAWARERRVAYREALGRPTGEGPQQSGCLTGALCEAERALIHAGRSFEDWDSATRGDPIPEDELDAMLHRSQADGGSWVEQRPPLRPLWEVCRGFLRRAHALGNGFQNTKYVLMEMLNSRRHPKPRVKSGELQVRGAVPEAGSALSAVTLQDCGKLKTMDAFVNAFGLREEAAARPRADAEGAKIEGMPRTYTDEYFLREREEDREQGSGEGGPLPRKRRRAA